MTQSPFEVLVRSWWAVFKRTVREFQDDNLSDWAAALTYYAALSIFPVLLAVVSFVGLIGGPAVRPLIDNFAGAAPPGPVSDVLLIAIDNLQHGRGQASVLMLAGIGAALWSGSGYIGTFIRASNAVLGTSEGRPTWQTMRVRLGFTLLVVALMTFSVVIVVFTGGPADQIGQMLGVGNTGVLVWNILKWPALIAAVAAMLAILYRAAPNVWQPGFRWITPGTGVAVALWLVASALFALYVANFGSYNQTYGALAGVIIFLVWLWVTNIAVLLGVQFDAELQRSQAFAAGHQPGAEPYAERHSQESS